MKKSKMLRSERGFASMLIVGGALALMATMVVVGMKNSATQARWSAKSLADVERLYAEEMSAISSYMWSTQTSTFSDTNAPVTTFENSFSGLVTAGAGIRLGDGVSKLSATAPADPGNVVIRRLGTLSHIIENSTGARLYCGDATVMEGSKLPPSSDSNLCLTQELCSGTIPSSCYETEPVDALYRSVLGRYIGAPGRALYVGQVATGAKSLAEVEAALRATVEYADNAPANCTGTTSGNHVYTPAEKAAGARYAESVINLYRALFGRFATSSEISDGAVRLLGCPGVTPVRAPVSLQAYIAYLKGMQGTAPAGQVEFTQASGNNGQLHAEPIRELFLLLYGQDPATADQGFSTNFPGMRFWLGRLTGQDASPPTSYINDTVSIDPPFIYPGTPRTYGVVGGPYAGAGNAMLYDEVETNPLPVANRRINLNGMIESTDYADIGGGATGSSISGLFRTILGRVPTYNPAATANPTKRPELNYYMRLMSAPYNAPLSYVAQSLTASDEFASRGGGCGCSRPPAPICRFTAPKNSINPGETIPISLYVADNQQVDASGHLNVGPPATSWDGVSPPGTLRTIFWQGQGNQPIDPGVVAITRNITGGAGGSTLTQNAVVSGPGGSSNCSISIPVINPRQSCSIWVMKRGPGPGSRWQFFGNGDVSYPNGYAVGGAESPKNHRFYNWWKVWIPARPDSEFSWSTSYRYGAGYDYVGGAAPLLVGGYDPCNRMSTPYQCAIDPYYLDSTNLSRIPPTYNYSGYTYRFLTRNSDGANVPYANGGACGSPDCKCWVTGVVSPLVIDFQGAGIRMRSGTYFDMGEGVKDKFWPVADGDGAGLLVLDRNGDGIINNGNELFGNFHRLPDGTLPSNGFDALLIYDVFNHDYKINKDDAVYADLRVWFDRNHNGYSESDELVPLPLAGVEEIYLRYQNAEEELDFYGNRIRQKSVVRLSSGALRPIVDAYFADGNPNDPGTPKMSSLPSDYPVR